ncbi:hypothetical protein SADUNF_Sadunf07G0039000 [Salix dunnii]|uniref:Reverse transcriptase domain-containing protein n=1 Tax=Salix dunnii TaxID=1413687 RepID=A0A835JZM5_9ROSI|nr:hypothetical protein SADUNF_Sadunf07G0039000 [Salix dunnii]
MRIGSFSERANWEDGFKKLSHEQAALPESNADAVWSCDVSKAPGLDGYNFRFYRKILDLIHIDLFILVNDVLQYGLLPKGCSHAYVALIPKKMEAIMLADHYRPICMVHGVYKIVSQVLSKRIAGIIQHVISDNQTGFIAGRQIVDGFMIASEAIHVMKLSRESGMNLKVDFHRAFDSALWDYLDETMHHMGFCISMGYDRENHYPHFFLILQCRTEKHRRYVAAKSIHMKTMVLITYYPKQENPQNRNQNFTTENQQPPSMENPDEKFQSLKTLNDLLVKEAKKHREQVEPLVKAKEALETKLFLSSNEKSKLETEFDKTNDGKVSLDIENGLFYVFIEMYMDEMGGFVNGLVREKKEKEKWNEIGVLKTEVKELTMRVEIERNGGER